MRRLYQYPVPAVPGWEPRRAADARVTLVILTTINVNGIRAAVKQRSTDNLGMLAWLKETRADVICLQETRADDAQLAEALAPAIADGWHLACAGAAPQGPQRSGGAVADALR